MQGACGANKRRLKILDYDLTKKLQLGEKKVLVSPSQQLPFIKIPS